MNSFPKIDPENLPPTLLVYGKDSYFRSRFLSQLRDQIRNTCEVYDLWCDDTTKSYDVINAVDRSVFPFEVVEQRAVFVWDFQKVKDRDTHLTPYLDDPPSKTLAVFVLTEGSRAGGAFIKALKGRVSYNAVSPEVNYQVDELTPWIQRYLRTRGLFVEEGLCRGLHMAVGQDLFVLESEMRRILTYCENRPSATLADFRELIVPRVHAQPFDLSKAVIKRDVGESMRTLHEMFYFADNPDAVVLSSIGLLATEFRKWFRIICMRRQEKKDFKQIAAELGGSPYVIEKKLWPHLKRFGARDLKKLLELEDRVCSVEYLVKRGALDGQIALELIVLEACGISLGRQLSEQRYPV